MQVASRTVQLQRPVEQQTPQGATQPDQSLWVVNPTGCGWDSDDKIEVVGYGALEPGESFQYSECVVADWVPHLVAIQGFSDQKRSQFEVEVTIDWTDSAGVNSFKISASSAPNVANGRYTVAQACLLTPEYDHETNKLSGISASNGGIGSVVNVSYVMRNTGSRTLRDPSLAMLIAGDFSYFVNQGCPASSPVWPLSQTGTCQGLDPRICYKEG